MADLPEFDDPPVVEMALGVQFRPVFALRGPVLGALWWSRWRDGLPRVEEQPALAPVLEESAPQGLTFQINLGPVPAMRQWFLSEDGAELVQAQADRLNVNWRQVGPGSEYPRYESMRERFARRFNDLSSFVEQEDLGSLAITQAEISYINALEGTSDGSPESILKGWAGAPDHHLGRPEQLRLGLNFLVPDVGRPPVRMHVALEPAQQPDGRRVSFLTFTVRGAPAEETLNATLDLMDIAHEHVVRSFAELVAEPLQEQWGAGHDRAR